MIAKNEFRGKNVEDAIQHALQQLKLTRDQVEIQVVHEGARGLLGLGASEAVVRVIPRSAPPPRMTPVAAKSTPEPVAAPQSAAAAGGPSPAPAEAAPKPAHAVNAQQASKETLETLLKGMGLQAQVVVRAPEFPSAPSNDPKAKHEGPEFILDIVGSDLGVLIGRRGETLRDLEFMTRLIVATRLNKQVRMSVDVEGYRNRRERLLRELAKRMAERVKQNRQPITLEAMPPHERRIVHITLRDSTTVRTESIGEGDHRRVMILPK